MDFISPILDVTCRLCGCIGNTTNYIRHLEDNLNSLGIEMGKLRAQRNDVNKRIEADEGPLMERTAQIDNWLGRVEELDREVAVLLQHGAEQIQKKCLRICPRNCLSSHKLGKKVCQKLQAVSDMKSEGKNIPVVVPLAPSHAQVIRHLEDNLNSLRIDMETLRAQRNDVKRRIEAGEGPLMKRTEQIVDWLRRVEELEGKVEVLLQHGDEQIQKKCLKICPRLGEEVCQKLQDVSEMMSKGNNIPVVEPLPREHAQEIPLDRIVGLDSNLHKLLGLLRDDDGHGVGIIGIYGMGGVGKTTLLKKLNNKLATDDQWRGKFDEVIWVVVSKDESSVVSVQDKIGKKLFRDKWRSDKSQDEKKQDIFRVLKMKRFVLLLDDIWKGIDLLEVGVPADNQNKPAKVVFTTRSEEVCGLMKAKKKIKVECLAEQQAWDLFKENVGEEILNSNPEIEKLAPDVCKECAGLPLALITIGRAMASKRAPREWNHAINELKKSTFKISGMEDEWLHRLKFSYDSLPDETIKICFLYCALYPEDWDIEVPNLIKYWIGEGFLDDECDDNIDEACNWAYDIIGRLKRACLLLEGRESDSIVNMHDVIRDMALWIVSDSGRKKEKYLVLKMAPPISKWKKAERVFLLDNSIEELIGTPICDNLLTLNLKDNYGLKTISDSFFQFMPSLKVLDLSDCDDLTFLPASFFKLLSLQHLDLSGTSITELSIEFKSLVKLKYLYMNYMQKLDMIPSQIISSLLFLQRLEMIGTGVSSEQVVDEGSILFGGNELLLDELECLNHLQYLSLTVKTELALKKLLSSQKLQSCIFGLIIKQCKGTSQLQLSSLQKNIKRLEILEIWDCDDLEELSIDEMRWDEKERATVHHKYNNPWNMIKSIIDGSRSFHNLQEVSIVCCKVLEDLTWLISVPNLRDLGIYECDAMKEVIKDADCNSTNDIGRERSLSVFARLQRLELRALPELKSIYSHSLSFPSLIKIHVRNCPKLNKLPFDSNSGKHTLQSIDCQREWRDKLEWENEETRSTFFPLFKYFIEN